MLRRIALMLAFALPAASWAQTLSETLPNGLKIIVKEDHRAPVAVSPDLVQNSAAWMKNRAKAA